MSEPARDDALKSAYANDPDMRELIELFVSELPQRVAKLEAVLCENDLAGFTTMVHQLKGAAGGYGYPDVTDAARRLETLARAQADADRLSAELKELVDLCQRVRAGAPETDA